MGYMWMENVSTKFGLQLERTRALYASTRWALGRAVTLTFDLLTPNIEAFVLVTKRTNAESMVKIRSILFKISC